VETILREQVNMGRDPDAFVLKVIFSLSILPFMAKEAELTEEYFSKPNILIADVVD